MSTVTSSTNFEAVIAAALEEYKRKTKKDIASHPLAAELKSCESPSAVLSILQAQIQTFDKSRSTDEMLTRWLDPTVNVLYAFSAILGDAVGLVIATVKAAQIYSLTCVAGISTFECDFCWDRYPLPSKHLS